MTKKPKSQEKVYRPATIHLFKERAGSYQFSRNSKDLPQLRGNLGFDPGDHFFPNKKGGGTEWSWVHWWSHAAI